MQQEIQHIVSLNLVCSDANINLCFRPDLKQTKENKPKFVLFLAGLVFGSTFDL